MIPADVAAQLELRSHTQDLVQYADGRVESVDVVGPIRVQIVEVEGRSTFDEACVLGDQVLIGQAVLEKLDLSVDCPHQRVVPNHPGKALNGGGRRLIVARMGEVRIKVRIINGTDEDNVRRGLLTVDQIRSVEAMALVDTGAARTVISEDVASRVGVTTRTQVPTQFADGRIQLVDLGGPLVVELEGRSTIDEAFIVGDQVLIRQTVLEKLDLLVDCPRQRVIPNPAHPDGPIARI